MKLFLPWICLLGTVAANKALGELRQARADLLEAVRRPQSPIHLRQVETIIERMNSLAKSSPRDHLRPLQSGSYRTVWTSVTADSVLGPLLGHTPGTASTQLLPASSS